MTPIAPWKRLVIGLAVAATPVVLLADQARQAAKPAPVDLATAPGPAAIRISRSTRSTRRRSRNTRPRRSSSRRSSTTCRRRRRVPTPTATLGDIAGAPGKLPYSKEVDDYMRLLAKSPPRVKVFSIGQTEEGREMIAVAVASEALLAQARREQGRPREARRSAHDPDERRAWPTRSRAGPRPSTTSPATIHSTGSRRADGADGAGLPAGRRRERRTSATSASTSSR